MSGAGESGNRYGIVLFLLLALVLIAVAVIAAGVTGPMGIEERFNAAAGLSAEPGALHEESGSGFSLEGHPLLYLVLIVILVIAGFLLHRKYRI